MVRCARSRRHARVESRVARCIGPSVRRRLGTLAAFGDRGPAVAASLGSALGLSGPADPWHAHRDRLASLACALGVATGTAGKIGRDLGLLAQTEVGEAHEPAGDAGGSSTMPHKRNPVRAAIVVAAAVRVPGLVATMLSAMLQEHERGLGGWQAEWETLPDLVIDRGTGGYARSPMRSRRWSSIPRECAPTLSLTGGLVLAEAVVDATRGRSSANRRRTRPSSAPRARPTERAATVCRRPRGRSGGHRAFSPVPTSTKRCRPTSISDRRKRSSARAARGAEKT